jgi:hypothetical protein
LPGVSAVAVTSQLPLGGNFDSHGIHREDKPSANQGPERAASR